MSILEKYHGNRAASHRIAVGGSSSSRKHAFHALMTALALTASMSMARADMLNGTTADDVLAGTANDDLLNGMAGNDILAGGAGKDIHDGGAGADIMIGGAGDDNYTVDNAADIVLELSNQGIDNVQTSISYTLPAHVENLLIASTTAIIGTGNDLANMITCNSVNTVGATLNGMEGDDKVTGCNGADKILGDFGQDELKGGLGADTFVYRAIGESSPSKPDTVVDFQATQGDKIDLSAIDTNPKKKKRQAFKFINAKPFSKKKKGQLRFANGVLEGEINGDGKADFAIKLTGVQSLSASALKLK